MATYKNMKEWETAIKEKHGNVSFSRSFSQRGADTPAAATAQNAKGKEVGQWDGKSNSGTISEMAIAFSTAPPMDVSSIPSAEVAAEPTEIEPDDYNDESIVVGSPVSQYDPADITVFANSITPVSYGGSEAVACFDVVFSVGVNCDSVSKTYQVVKRVGIDKCRIASEASCSTPVSVVEAKSAALKEEAAATAKRFRRLAGLS